MAQEYKTGSENELNEIDETLSGNILLIWDAPEYEYYEKTTDWYWWVGLIAVILLGIGVWQKSFLFAVLVLLSWFTIALYAVRKPQLITCAIAERGLVVGTKLYLWQDIKSFWIFYNPPSHRDLSIASKKQLSPSLRIHLGDN